MSPRLHRWTFGRKTDVCAISALLTAVLALTFPLGASAVTVEWHSVHPCNGSGCWWTPGASRRYEDFASRLEVKGNTATLEEALRHGGGQFANFSLPDYGWESPDGWWCRAGEVFAPGAIYTIPNPKAIPTGWWGSPQCRSMTTGPEGDHWFTDPGTESVGRVAANGTITEYPLPELPEVARGYEGDSYGTPAAITTEGSELWVASSSGEGMFSVNPNGVSATIARRHHHRRRR